MLIKIYPENPEPKKIEQVKKCLENGGLIIFPTDTVYAIGCDITKTKAIEKICKIKGIDITKANFSILCSNLSHLSEYAKVMTPVYKMMKKATPGPFTFILEGTSNVPKIFKSKRTTIGIRIPDNNIIQTIITALGNPLTSTSIHDDDEVVEYSTDPELIHEKYEKLVDMVIDGGYGGIIPSTVIDCTSSEPEIIRQGLGEITF